MPIPSLSDFFKAHPLFNLKTFLGEEFKYCDIHKVYTIVIYEESTKEFKKTGRSYLHKGKTVFDTGLKLEMIQEYYLIALDVFKKEAYTLGNNNLTGWLRLLSAGNFDELADTVGRFPWLTEAAEEIRAYLHKPGKVDEQKEMIDERDRTIDELRAEIERLKSKK